MLVEKREAEWEKSYWHQHSILRQQRENRELFKGQWSILDDFEFDVFQRIYKGEEVIIQ